MPMDPVVRAALAHEGITDIHDPEQQRKLFKLIDLPVPGHECDERPPPELLDYLIGQSRWVPFAVTGGVLLFFGVLYAFHVYWRWLQQKRSARSAAILSAENLGTSIVRRFLPSVAVDAYHFRGMRRKAAPVGIRFEELGLTLQDGRSVLDGVSGAFEPGRMVAIMGPSGAGKTTFMNVLCGKATYGTMTGQVWFNEGQLDLPGLKPVMGFVPQDDVVHERLTVRENVHFSAQLRNPRGTPADLIDDIVEDVLNVMQITHIQSSIVGSVEERGISGGQRKRVNIGLELAACPTVLYLDEPTSGLDSTSSLQIINSLGKMSHLQMTIAMVIHQPRYPLFTLFDDVLLLGPGGRTVYLGPSQQAKPYFQRLGFEMPESENPADWFMDILSGVVPNDTISEFKPAKLFDIWVEKKTSVPNKVTTRALSKLEDCSVLVRVIDEEWSKIDDDSSDNMDFGEFKRFLETCGERSPQPDAVTALFQRISAGSLLASKQDLVNFVQSLRDGPGGSDGDTKDVSRRAAAAGGAAAGSAGEAFIPLLPEPTAPAASVVVVRPGFFEQVKIVLARRLAQFMRESKQRSVDLGLIVACALGVGCMHRGGMGTDKELLPTNLVMFFVGISLLATVSSLKVFGANRPLFWRESASGISVSGFYLAKVLGNVFDLLLQCHTYALVYFLITRPAVPYWHYFVPCALVSFASGAWGYLISAVVEPQNATTAAVIFALVGCGILGNPMKMDTMLTGGAAEVLMVFSLSRWAIPMALTATVDHADHNGKCVTSYLKGIQSSYDDANFFMFYDDWNRGVIMLSATALIVCIAGFLGLKFTNRSKQV